MKKENILSQKVLDYIERNWDSCIKENRQDEGTLLGLPYPYTVPAVGHFDEMYYWDTYFTNKGLELCGRISQAKNNTDNMLYMVNKYGFMPNGNRQVYLSHSQPPFLSVMVRDVYEYYRDPVWLGGAYQALTKEYAFWTTERGSHTGLSRYDEEVAEERIKPMADRCAERMGYRPDLPDELLARHMLATCESGWDINPRWDLEGYHFAPVDLNSLLYLLEGNMAYFAKELDNGCESEWLERQRKRRERMVRYMQNAEGLFLDHNFVTGKQSIVFSAASLFPLYAGLADDQQAECLVQNLHRLEAPYGLLTCEKNEVPGTFQWDYPNGWACLQYIAIIGLDRYGYREEAARLARKYTALVEKVFEETGNLWEKYNVVEGNINVANEYAMPPMMGWSAGVYLAALHYLDETVY